MPDWGLFLFLVIAVGLGFGLGRWRNSKAHSEPTSGSLEPHYLQGLNYLLNERPDAAIDSFIDSLAVNHETLETHLALGNLLRKRGEADRAVRIHQNLLSRPYLGEEQTLYVQMELARDFISAGLLDRAELLLRELLESGTGSIRNQCLQYLIEIYRDEKEWQKGVEAINQLAGKRFSRLQEQWRPIQAHYYCELAEDALEQGDHLQARRHLQAAMAADRQSARSSLLMGELERRQGNEVEALKNLRQVFHQDPSLLPVALPSIRDCFLKLDDADGLARYLDGVLQQSGSASVALERARLMATEDGAERALTFLRQKPELHGSLSVAREMLGYQAGKSQADEESLELVQQVLDQLQDSSVRYRCQKCGFGGHQFHWLCPSCKSWDSVKPVD